MGEWAVLSSGRRLIVLAAVLGGSWACQAPVPESPPSRPASSVTDSGQRSKAPAHERQREALATLDDLPRWALPQDDFDDDGVVDRPRSAYDESSRTKTAAGFGLGGTFDPDTFLVTGHADFYLSDRVAIGPLLQIGVDDDFTVIAPSFTIKGVVDIETDGPRLRPFLLGGIGFAFIEDDDRPPWKDDDDIGLMLNVGLGLDVFVAEDISIGTSAILNILPGEVLGESLFVSLQVLYIDLHF